MGGFYRSGLEGVYMVHIPRAPPECRNLRNVTFLPTQEKKIMAQRTNTIVM